MILDKHPHLKTVVNKTGNIETEFRVFPMEVIAGINSTETEVVQHGAKFKLDFAKVVMIPCMNMSRSLIMQTLSLRPSYI